MFRKTLTSDTENLLPLNQKQKSWNETIKTAGKKARENQVFSEVSKFFYFLELPYNI